MRMETLVDDNYLNGELTITFVNKMTIAKLYVIVDDRELCFCATTECAKTDEYNKNVGIKIVKLKVARKYYKYIRNRERAKIKKLQRILNSTNQILSKANYKIDSINITLNDLRGSD